MVGEGGTKEGRGSDIYEQKGHGSRGQEEGVPWVLLREREKERVSVEGRQACIVSGSAARWQQRAATVAPNSYRDRSHPSEGVREKGTAFRETR
jgi:hypothetical protein